MNSGFPGSGFPGFQDQQRQQLQWQQQRLQHAWWDRQQRDKRQRAERQRHEEEQRQAAARAPSRPPPGPAPFSAPAWTQTPSPLPPTTVERGWPRRMVRPVGALVLLVVSTAVVLATEAWQLSIALAALALWLVGRRTPAVEAGVATAVETRMTGERHQTLAFRLERWNRRGEHLAPVAVTAKGSELRGQIRDGDRVEVTGRRARDGSFRATSVLCLDTGETVRMKKRGRIATAVNVVLSVVVIAIWLAILLAFIAAVTSSGG